MSIVTQRIYTGDSIVYVGENGGGGVSNGHTDGSLPGELMSTDMTIRMPYKIALAVTAALLTAIGGGYAANKAGSSGEQERVASLETRMDEQQAQIEGLKGDVRETRANTVQILLLLGNRHDN